MADPTASQAIVELRKVKESVLQHYIEESGRYFDLANFSKAINYGKKALPLCDELGNEEQAQNMHMTLSASYLALARGFEKKRGNPEEALENAKLALKHCKEIDNKEFRKPTHLRLCQVFFKLQDFGEALVNGAEMLSYFEENDDNENKLAAQDIMARAYYLQALNSLNNQQFKEASDNGELALLCFKDDESLTIKIRWLLVEAYFLQGNFKNALKQFDSDTDMLSQERDAEGYITAGKIHKQMGRYHEAKMYFEKAKKDATKRDASELIKTANELIRGG